MKKSYIAAATLAMVIGVHSLLACYQQDVYICEPANTFLGYIWYPQSTCSLHYISGVVTFDIWYAPTVAVVSGSPYINATYSTTWYCEGEYYTYDSCITGYDYWGPSPMVSVGPKDASVASTSGCQ